MESTRYHTESIVDLWAELLPLLRAHWEELAPWQDIPLNPDPEFYEAMETAGMLYAYTVRVDGVLAGYGIYIVRTHPHSRDSTQAYQDALYVSPGYRRGGIGRDLIEYADRELAKEGAEVVYQHVKKAHDFGRLLESIGYEYVEKIYAKRIG